MNEIFIAVAGLISIAGGGYFGSLFTKSKYAQEVALLKEQVKQNKETAENLSIDNDIKLSQHYREVIDDLKPRYEKQYREFEEVMNRKVSLLEEEIKLKDRKINLQKQEILELKRENKRLKTANK